MHWSARQIGFLLRLMRFTRRCWSHANTFCICDFPRRRIHWWICVHLCTWLHTWMCQFHCLLRRARSCWACADTHWKSPMKKDVHLILLPQERPTVRPGHHHLTRARRGAVRGAGAGVAWLVRSFVRCDGQFLGKSKKFEKSPWWVFTCLTCAGALKSSEVGDTWDFRSMQCDVFQKQNVQYKFQPLSGRTGLWPQGFRMSSIWRTLETQLEWRETAPPLCLRKMRSPFSSGFTRCAISFVSVATCQWHSVYIFDVGQFFCCFWFGLLLHFVWRSDTKSWDPHYSTNVA